MTENLVPRELTQEEKVLLKELMLSPKQEDAVRSVWKLEKQPAKSGIKGGLIKILIPAVLPLLASILLTINILQESLITSALENIVVFAVYICIATLVIIAFLLFVMSLSKERKVLLSYFSMSLMKKTGRAWSWIVRLISILFLILYVINGHVITGILLLLAGFCLKIAAKNLFREIGKTLEQIDQTIDQTVVIEITQ